MRKLLMIFGILLPSLARGQEDTSITTSALGFEVDVIPYVTGGYYGSVWYGYKHVRFRAVIAKVTTPDFIVEDGFTNNKIQAYAFITDYFFKPNFEKWWIAAGFEYWKGEIQTDAQLSTAKYNNTVFTVGGGYVWKISGHFYINPWAAGHIRIAGDSKVVVDNKEFEPNVFIPEASLKFGYYFSLK
jgi:hypothetical protein